MWPISSNIKPKTKMQLIMQNYCSNYLKTISLYLLLFRVDIDLIRFSESTVFTTAISFCSCPVDSVRDYVFICVFSLLLRWMKKQFLAPRVSPFVKMGKLSQISNSSIICFILINLSVSKYYILMNEWLLRRSINTLKQWNAAPEKGKARPMYFGEQSPFSRTKSNSHFYGTVRTFRVSM